MGYAAKRAQRERVQLADGYWALVQKLNLAGKQAARRVLYGQVQLQEGVQRIGLGELALAEATRRLLADNILDWNLDGEPIAEGEPAPILDITYETVNGLDMADQETILRAILAGDTELMGLLTMGVAAKTAPEAADAPAPLDSTAFPVGSPGSSPTTPPPAALTLPSAATSPTA